MSDDPREPVPAPEGAFDDSAPTGAPRRELESDTPLTHDDSRAMQGRPQDPIGRTQERIALRDDLARQLEDLIADARSWLDESEDPEAQGIVDDLTDIYERLSAPLDATDDETGMDLGEGR